MNEQVKFNDIPSDVDFNNLSGDEFSKAYLEEHSDITDEEYFGLFGSRKRAGKATPGGKKWSKANAKKFAGQAPGKVESSRTYLKAIIGQDPAKVKEKRVKDFAQMVWASKENQKKLEAAWTSFQNAQKGGWDNANNRSNARTDFNTIVMVEANSKRDWKDRHDWVTESILDKGAQAFKTVNLAPFRAMLMALIKFNLLNVATSFKLSSIRTPDKYASLRLKYKQLGGNRTQWDKAVDKGYKKKPLLAKKMKINWDTVSFDGDYNADATPFSMVTPSTPTPLLTPATTNSSTITAQQVADAQQVVNIIKTTQDAIPKKPDDPNQKIFKFPDSALAAAPAAGVIAGALVVGVWPVAAGTAVIGGSCGTLLTSLMEIVNECKIPMGDNEDAEPVLEPSGEKSITPTEKLALSTAYAEEMEKDKRWISFVPNWATGVVASLVVLSLIGWGLSAAGVFKKKSK